MRKDLRELLIVAGVCVPLIAGGLFYPNIREFFSKRGQANCVVPVKNYPVSSDSLKLEDDATVYGMIRARY